MGRFTLQIYKKAKRLMVILLAFVIHWYFSLFFQTIFLHRYASHNMFKMKPVVEKIFYFLTFVFQGSSFLNPAAYGVMHKRHHAHADTEKDPHSPVHIKNFFSFNWTTVIEYRKLVNEFASGERVDKTVPRWKAMESLAESLLTRAGFIVLYFVFYYYYTTANWQYLLLPVHVMMGPIHGFIVNWFGHKRGYRNYDSLSDNSKNTLPIDFLMMGELYQNNHHFKPSNINFAVKWFEYDFGYLATRFLKTLKLIY